MTKKVLQIASLFGEQAMTHTIDTAVFGSQQQFCAKVLTFNDTATMKVHCTGNHGPFEKRGNDIQVHP
jgi:hypothetical protein